MNLLNERKFMDKAFGLKQDVSSLRCDRDVAIRAQGFPSVIQNRFIDKTSGYNEVSLWDASLSRMNLWNEIKSVDKEYFSTE